MNKRQENKLTAYDGLISLAGENPEPIAALPAMGESFESFKGVVTELEDKNERAKTATAGKAATKTSARGKLIDSTYRISNAICLVARKQNDAELYAKADVSESDLWLMRDTELGKRAQSIASWAEPIATALASFLVTADDIADLKTKAGVFVSAIGSRESSVAEQKGATKSVKSLFAKADEILTEELDRQAELLRDKFPDFHEKYWAARVVKDTGIRHKGDGEAAAPSATPSSTQQTK